MPDTWSLNVTAIERTKLIEMSGNTLHVNITAIELITKLIEMSGNTLHGPSMFTVKAKIY